MKLKILLILPALAVVLTACAKQTLEEAKYSNQSASDQLKTNINQGDNQPLNQNNDQPAVKEIGGDNEEKPIAVNLVCESGSAYSDQNLNYKINCPENWAAYISYPIPDKINVYSIDFIPNKFYQNGNIIEGENHYLPTLTIWEARSPWEQSLQAYATESWEQEKSSGTDEAQQTVSDLTEVKTDSGIIGYQYTVINPKQSWQNDEHCVFPRLNIITLFLNDKKIIAVRNAVNSFCSPNSVSKTDLETDVQNSAAAYDEIIKSWDWINN